MKFSIIIPVYNAQDTLKACLDSIFSLKNKDFEVIIVDDKSTDKSLYIANKYPCKIITLEENGGAGSARNAGKDKSQGEILVFIDSDVVIKNNTLNLIEESFKEDTDVIAITGMLARECHFNDFFSQYKNLYMNFIFKKCPRHVDFLYGSIIAIRRDSFLKFNEKIKLTDDTELGQRYKESGKNILLNHGLEVIHLKKYSFWSIIKNDFSVPFWWAKSFMMHKGYLDILKKKRFAHARMSQILSILASYLFIMSLILWNYPGAGLISFFLLSLLLLLNFEFFLFLYTEKGTIFMIKSILFTYMDMLIMGLGIISGFIRFRNE